MCFLVNRSLNPKMTALETVNFIMANIIATMIIGNVKVVKFSK